MMKVDDKIYDKIGKTLLELHELLMMMIVK